MKKSLFGVKKATLAIATTLLIGTNNAFAGGIPVIDVSAIANQVKDYAMQLQQYEQMYSQLQQQIQMVQMQKQNLERLTKEDWDNLGTVLYQTRNVMNKVNGISYDIGNVSRKFEDTYKNFEGYSNDLENATNESERNKIYSDRYKQIAETNQNTFNGTLQQLELRYQDLESEDALIAKLKQNSQNSNGNLQAVQATNDLLAYQIDEIRKLRSVIMDQSNMLTNYLASQNNQRIMQQAKIDKFIEDTGYIEKTWGKSNPDALKWK
ncbi:TPA: P-type conjugative transfer protein TrbJ [Campylobacter coli]|nr:P-type conjugative transfer protein TrbJ [Campylobacter coli]HED7892719.1 P-type conjugative transfer protein TrbJ [Campylobacter coli]HED7902109.1 P-type conjugative transfer protein TrbJ [Campylobacter coli]HED8277989.1 P-type conjugative transfer protein TrbJ [Campylobacter coli]HED8287268.1 P-type conjugative transfer protein TrbJ [Campylobacter coli]